MMGPFHEEKEHRGAESRSGEEDAELRFHPVKFQVTGGWALGQLRRKGRTGSSDWGPQWTGAP